MSIQREGRKGQTREQIKIIKACKNERQTFQVSKYLLAHEASFRTSEVMHSSAMAEIFLERPLSACLCATHQTSLQLLAFTFPCQAFRDSPSPSSWKSSCILIHLTTYLL